MAKGPNRILVVDDEPMARQAVWMTLARYGYEVVTCTSGVEALERFKKMPFDLAIVDERMEGLKGSELAKCFRAQKVNFPVILVSASEMGNVEGVAKTFMKPVTPDVLRIAVEKLLQQEAGLESTEPKWTQEEIIRKLRRIGRLKNG